MSDWTGPAAGILDGGGVLESVDGEPFAGGRAEALTRGMAFDGQPRFSPDGERVVFVSDRKGGVGVWIMALDGSDTVRITSGPVTNM